MSRRVSAGARCDAGYSAIFSMWTPPRPPAGPASGGSLVDAVLDWAKTSGAEAVELWVTRGNVGAESRDPAAGFVDAGGYQPLPSDPCKEEVRMRVDL